MTKESSDYKTIESRRASAKQRQVVKHLGQATASVIGIGSSIISFTAFGLSRLTIVIVTLSILFLLSLLANVMFYFDSRANRQNVKQIAFLTPCSGTEPFYATMLVNIIQNASLALGQDYVIIPSMPTRSFETMSIWSLFSGLEDRQLDIDGIIFIPDQPDQHFDELVSFHEELGDIPLVLVDVYFDLAACDERTRARLPSFVGGDEVTGGRLAADIMIEAVGAAKLESPVMLIINGGTAPWEKQRSKFFREQISATWPDINFIDTPFLNYSRPAAFEFVVNMIRENSDAARVVELNGIFACNDDMAIGAHGAMIHMIGEGYSFVRPPQIVGYDGIVEIREYLNAGDPYIAGTVDVQIEEQAKTAMLLIHKLLRSGQRRTEVQLVTPVAVRRRAVSVSQSAGPGKDNSGMPNAISGT